MRKSKMLHSSERRFSTGVPVSAKRKGARKRFTARVVLVAWFLMYWASSSTTKPHSTRASCAPSMRTRS